jgi:type I restriction enzyme S subunit
MELKPGYKRSEIGVIPSDWDLQRLGHVTGITTGRKDVNEGNPSGEYPFFTCSREPTFSDGYSFDMEAILIAGNGDVGNLHYYSGKFEAYQRTYILSRFAIDVRYIWHQLDYRLVRSLGLGKIGSSIPYIKKENLTGFDFPVPSTNVEQRAIAEALSDADALLDGLDRLIAKKRDLKQATMQQLLTGKTRLPGFSGEWAVGSLDMVTSRATGVWGNHEPDERNSRRAEIIRAGDISQDGKLTATANRYVAPAEFEKAKCDLDDLVITTSGNGLGKLWWCDGRSDVAASNFVRVLQPIKGKAIGRFLYYALRTCEGSRQLQQHTATSAYPNLRPTYFSTSWISLPPLPEQAAIAAVLSDMDAELEALEARREKVQSLKHAMMQELLTGKTRLVAPECAHA